MVLVCHVISQGRVIKESRQGPMQVSYHPAKSGKGDLIILVCHTVLQDHVIKRPFR